MICVRVDFHSRVIFTRVNKIQAMYERLNPRSTFTSMRKRSYIASILFTCVKLTHVRHVKITRLWKPTLRCLSHTGHCLIFDWRVLSPKSRTFSPNDIYLKNGGRKGLANQFMFRTFFLHQTRLLTSRGLSLWRKMQISSSSGLFVLVIRLYKVNFVLVSHVD